MFSLLSVCAVAIVNDEIWHSRRKMTLFGSESPIMVSPIFTPLYTKLSPTKCIFNGSIETIL